MDCGQLTGVVFLDLKKAFDTVDHNLLLSKLSLFGITDIELEWFSNYLHDRKQCTSIKNTLSLPAKVELGVPQGSILGPQLFSLFVNDLPTSVSKAQVVMYADDTMLMYSDKSLINIQSCLNNELNRVNEWLVKNRLVLNTSKTKYMIIGTPHKLSNINEPIVISVNNEPLERVYNFKYLGVYLDQSLNWNDHLEYNSKKIGSKISLLRRLRPLLTEQSSKLLVNSLILPHFDYCSPVWSNCNQYLKNTLLKQQKKIGRIILQVDTRTPTSDVFTRLRWVSIEERWKFQRLKLTYNAIKGNTPLYLSTLFTHSAARHSYHTRGAVNYGICIPKVKTEKGKKSISYEGPLLWNNLSQNLRNAQTVNAFTSMYWRMHRT